MNEITYYLIKQLASGNSNIISENLKKSYEFMPSHVGPTKKPLK